MYCRLDYCNALLLYRPERHQLTSKIFRERVFTGALCLCGKRPMSCTAVIWFYRAVKSARIKRKAEFLVLWRNSLPSAPCDNSLSVSAFERKIKTANIIHSTSAVVAFYATVVHCTSNHGHLLIYSEH